MSAKVFYYSPGSRYSYLALSQMVKIETEFDVSFDWLPVVGARVREIRGVDPFEGPPQSQQYDWGYRQSDAEAWANYYAIKFVEPRSVKFDSTLLGCAAIAAHAQGEIREYSWQLACAVFANNQWPIDQALCCKVADDLKLDHTSFLSSLVDPETTRQVEANCRQAVKQGAFGTPTFLLGETLIWGNDRLPLLKHALAATRA